MKGNPLWSPWPKEKFKTSYEIKPYERELQAKA